MTMTIPARPLADPREIRDRRDDEERRAFPLEVRILTDGTAAGTLVWFNGVLQHPLAELKLSLRAGGNLKVQGLRPLNGRVEPFSFYGPGDIEKMNDRRPPEGVIGAGLVK